MENRDYEFERKQGLYARIWKEEGKGGNDVTVF